LALPILINCGGTVDDGVAWYVVDPQLTDLSTNNPQFIKPIVGAYTNDGYWCFTNVDTYMPTIAASNEGDFTLAASFSGSALVTGESDVNPSLTYTGAQSVDAPGCVGQCDNGYADPIIGSSVNLTGRFGDYSACALVTNLVSRGIMFCAGEYGGTDVWNTFIYQVRME
jgi:hypothetical protein